MEIIFKIFGTNNFVKHGEYNNNNNNNNNNNKNNIIS